jgi:hypothetical protein
MHFRPLRHPVSALVALVLALGLVGTAGVAAQGIPSTPPPDLSGAIAQGTCDAPGQATIQVGDFVRINQSEIVGSQDIAFSLRAQRNVDSTLDGLFGQTPYVFLVVDNANPGAGPVACGALGGVNVNGQVTIALTAPDPMMAGRDLIVGVAIFGATTPEGPTTQPAAQPGQLPVQAYLSEAALTQPEAQTTAPTPTPTTAPASPTAAHSSPEPTMAPTMPPTTAPTMAPTRPPTAPPTSPPTAPPTSPPTAPPTSPPTAPPTSPA